MDSYPVPYLSFACALGVTASEVTPRPFASSSAAAALMLTWSLGGAQIETFALRLDKALTEFSKRRTNPPPSNPALTPPPGDRAAAEEEDGAEEAEEDAAPAQERLSPAQQPLQMPP